MRPPTSINVGDDKRPEWVSFLIRSPTAIFLLHCRTGKLRTGLLTRADQFLLSMEAIVVAHARRITQLIRIACPNPFAVYARTPEIAKAFNVQALSLLRNS